MDSEATSSSNGRNDLPAPKSHQTSFPQRPTPNPDGEVPSPDHWNKPNRWEKEKAANQRFNMTRVLSKRIS